MTPLRLVWRQFTHERWPALLLALSVAILAALTTATPRLMATLDDRQLTETLSGLSAIQGDVAGSWAQPSTESPVAGLPDPWEPHREALEAIRGAQPEPLRSLLAEPQFLAELPALVTTVPPVETGYYETRFYLFIDPALPTYAELVEGAWPAPRPEASGSGVSPTEPQEVAAPEDAAASLGWEIGEAITDELVLSGTFRPTDESETRWEHVPYGRTIVEQEDPNRGTSLTTGLFLPPSYLATSATVEELGPGVQETLTLTAWFGVATSQLADINVRELRSQLSGLLAQRYPVLPPNPDDEGSPPAQFPLGSELGRALDSIASQQDVTRAAVAVAAAGPLAVGVALVALAAQLMIERRRTTIELVAARGLAWRQLRALLSLEGLALGVPAAVLGQTLGSALTPGAINPWMWLLTPALGAAAAIAMSWAARRVAPIRGRADLRLRPGRWRVAVEAVTLIASAAALWALLTRGDTPVEGLGLLATATPVLLTLAMCLLAVRLYPAPLRLAGRWLHKGRGLAGFLGTMRAQRDPAGGLTPVFTVILGTTIAVLSATLLGSIIAGTERATWEETGSSIHVSGPRITDDMRTAMQEIDGVAAVARLHDAGTNRRLSQGSESRVRLWLADPALERAYAASPFGSPLPDNVFTAGGAPTVAVNDGLPISTGNAQLEGIGEVKVAGTLGVAPGIRIGGNWALMSTQHWPDGMPLPAASLALVAVEQDADIEEVTRQLAEAVGNARIVTAAAELAAVRNTPTVSGMTTTFLVLTAATAGLLTLTLLGSQLMATRARTHLGSILRTLGMGRRELRALTTWEIAPSALMGLFVGTGTGIGLAALLLHNLDFRSLTGGAHQPPLHLDPALLGAVIGVLTLTVAVAIAATVWLVGRTNLAQELRIGEER